MGQPKKNTRGKVKGPRKPLRARRGAKKQRETKLKKALGIPGTEILPHMVGRGRWQGMRDYAPEENGPVRVRKVEQG